MVSGDVTGPRWVGGVNAPAPGGGDYEALVKWLHKFKGPGSNGTNEAADAIEALVEDRDGWRDAARTYKSSRDASDARAEALAAERDGLRAQLDGACSHPFSRLKFDGGARALVCDTCDTIVTHLAAVEEGDDK